MQKGAAEAQFPHRHMLGIEGLSPGDINQFLDLADGYVELNRQADKKRSTWRGALQPGGGFRVFAAERHLSGTGSRARSQAAQLQSGPEQPAAAQLPELCPQ